MDSTTAFNLNNNIKKLEKEHPSETAGTIASAPATPLYTPVAETAGAIASNSSSSSVNYNA